MGKSKKRKNKRHHKRRYITREEHCPNCGNILNASQGLGSNKGPRPGDYGVCIHCTAILVYDNNKRRTLLSTGDKLVIQDKEPGLWELLLEMQRVTRTTIIDPYDEDSPDELAYRVLYGEG